MKRFLKIVCVLAIVFCLMIIGLMRYAEQWLISHLPAEIDALSSPMLSLSADSIERGSCLWQACVHVRGLRLQLPRMQPLILDDLTLTLSPLSPNQISFQGDMPAFHLDASMGATRWDIRRLNGQIGSFLFDINGRIDISRSQGDLTLTTSGLRQFLDRFVTLPWGMNLLIKDTPQTFHLTPKDGALTLFGFPVISLH